MAKHEDPFVGGFDATDKAYREGLVARQEAAAGSGPSHLEVIATAGSAGIAGTAAETQRGAKQRADDASKTLGSGKSRAPEPEQAKGGGSVVKWLFGSNS